MRNLIAFISKHNFFFLFFLLEVICFTLLIRNNNYQKAGFINSANKLAGSIYETNSEISGYLHLKKTNELLSKENAELRTHSLQSYMKVYTKIKSVKDTVYKQQYTYISAKVVNNTTNKRNNYITINIGFKQGIKPDMAVISSSGIVGIVKAVSENFSSVMSFLHKNSKVSSKLEKDGSFGPLSWEGDDHKYATLKDIPTHVRIKKGDAVVTSAYSATFPEGVPVGTVDSFERKQGEYFFTVKVLLATDFKKLDYVYVVNNMLKEEQEQLEKASQND